MPEMVETYYEAGEVTDWDSGKLLRHGSIVSFPEDSHYNQRTIIAGMLTRPEGFMNRYGDVQSPIPVHNIGMVRTDYADGFVSLLSPQWKLVISIRDDSPTPLVYGMSPTATGVTSEQSSTGLYVHSAPANQDDAQRALTHYEARVIEWQEKLGVITQEDLDAEMERRMNGEYATIASRVQSIRGMMMALGTPFMDISGQTDHTTESITTTQPDMSTPEDYEAADPWYEVVNTNSTVTVSDTSQRMRELYEMLVDQNLLMRVSDPSE